MIQQMINNNVNIRVIVRFVVDRDSGSQERRFIDYSRIGDRSLLILLLLIFLDSSKSTTVKISSKCGRFSDSYDQHFSINRYISDGVLSGVDMRYPEIVTKGKGLVLLQG